LPFLAVLTIVSSYTNFLALYVLLLIDIKYFVVGPVDELTVVILEDLEPS